MLKTVNPRELRAMFDDGAELALLDAREEAAFGAAHLLYASCVPLSRLEMKVPVMVPRLGARVVWCDGGEGLAERAAERLTGFGWHEVSVLAGGVPAWAQAGYEVFSGVNVISKAFGEVVELVFDTPSLAPQELRAMMDAGEDLVVLDSRPLPEYQARSIPGGVCTPGAELLYRVATMAPSPHTTVVVNCAGRTRSIIGAQSLRNADVPNTVLALRNGTMGWHLAGFPVETGARRRAPDPTPAQQEQALARATAVAERFGVKVIDTAMLATWEAEREQRTLYLLDVRQPEEYEAGHLAGSLCSPGGQLVQETDHTVATLGARIVLVDDTGVRSRMTAAWLQQMGWDAVVLDGALAGELETGPQVTPILGLDDTPLPVLSPEAVDDLRQRGQARVLDLSLSRAFRNGHVPGAVWGVRARLHRALAKLPAGGTVVLVSEDDRLARLAGLDVAALDLRPLAVLEGGMRAWRGARLALDTGTSGMADEADDLWLRPYERDAGQEDAMRDYLSWEVDLVEQLRRDGSARFALPPRQPAS